MSSVGKYTIGSVELAVGVGKWSSKACCDLAPPPRWSGLDRLAVHGALKDWGRADCERLMRHLVLERYLQEEMVAGREDIVNAYLRPGPRAALLTGPAADHTKVCTARPRSRPHQGPYSPAPEPATPRSLTPYSPAPQPATTRSVQSGPTAGHTKVLNSLQSGPAADHTKVRTVRPHSRPHQGPYSPAPQPVTPWSVQPGPTAGHTKVRTVRPHSRSHQGP